MISGRNREPLSTQLSRQSHQDTRSVLFQEKPFTVKRVYVTDIDTLFTNIIEAFNKQQADCLAIRAAIQDLKETSCCSPVSSLSVCIEKIQQEHSAYNVQVHMEGYRFWLDSREKDVPEKLEWAQQQVGELNRATKGVISTETKLQEMISLVLQSQEMLVERVKVTNPEYLDQIRLERNLRENIEKISLAKQFSKQYREEANSVLVEISKSANLTL
ncbi:uncharacterized protein LOC133382115 isoform X2 [Rhineura floridana]|uniref:uncharacterized protein LOC133382115 isoform X2 n=1 Tax=Rhineura floridana TaxID=261503 RepID=UPI002AC7EDA0|nr:uncharacterized protein LOC133382115 isoform X2 [Rhineura floridana]